MKYIQDYVLEIDEELENAKEYAEKAIYWKYENNMTRYKYYAEMSNDELKHTKMLHDMATDDINKMKEQGYKAPERMQEIWNKSHADYVENTAWIRQILAL